MNENTKKLIENQLIGVQGEQGKDVYCFCNTGCDGTLYRTESENVTNIYNYFGSTGIECRDIPVIEEIPTNTYFYIFSQENQLQVTPYGVTMPFSNYSYYSNGIYPIRNSQGKTVSFHLRSSGFYELSYNIYFNEEVQIGAKVRKDTIYLNGSSLRPNTPVSELSGRIVFLGYSEDLVSIDLFSESDLMVEFRKEIAASVTIKKIALQ